MQPPKSVLVQFDSAPAGRPPRPMMAFDDALFIEPHTMMQTLRQFLHSNGVQFIQQRVHSFDDLRKCQITMNCTGIGAKQLCDDRLIHSVQGHLILLKDQEPSEINYMLIHWFEEDSANGNANANGQTRTASSAGGQSIKRAFYVFPKRSSTTDPRAIGVIGGTFIDGADADTPNTDEFELVLKNAENFLAGNN